MGFLGGEVGLELLLVLAAASAAAAALGAAIRRAPPAWQRRGLPELVFAAVLAVQLAILAARSLAPLDLDVDTAAHAAALADASTLREVILLRGPWQADYLLQGPLVHALRRVLPIGPLGAYRLLAFAGAIATALLLRTAARRLGAGPWEAALAGLFPLCSFGPAWLTLSLDDNAAASALEWGFFLALLRALPRAGEERTGAGGTTAGVIGAGLLLGAAVSFHRKAMLWGALLPLAPLVARELRSPAALRGLAQVGALAVATHLLAAACFLPTGLDASALSQLLMSPHHDNPAWWFPASDLDARAQAAAVWDGLRASLVVFPLVSGLMLGPAPFTFLDLLIVLFAAALALAGWQARGRAGCRLLILALALQCGHSLLYEPRSPERWDTLVAGAGVLVAVAATGASRAVWRYAAAWLWVMLLATQHASTHLYVEAVELGRALRSGSAGGALEAPGDGGETEVEGRRQ